MIGRSDVVINNDIMDEKKRKTN